MSKMLVSWLLGSSKGDKKGLGIHILCKCILTSNDLTSSHWVMSTEDFTASHWLCGLEVRPLEHMLLRNIPAPKQNACIFVT